MSETTTTHYSGTLRIVGEHNTPVLVDGDGNMSETLTGLLLPLFNRTVTITVSRGPGQDWAVIMPRQTIGGGSGDAS